MMSILKKQQINNRKREFREIFTSIDTDGDGFIDAEELRSTLRILFPGNDEMKLTDEELNEMISEFDSDHDNRLNFDGKNRAVRNFDQEIFTFLLFQIL